MGASVAVSEAPKNRGAKPAAGNPVRSQVLSWHEVEDIGILSA